ncbi:UDP-GalNAc:beta-1,3-N-acetylgalactosaminyltransferase 1-like [Rhipicephalus sanguineus]|uniref:UDP-GalNAc:beta-1, 3-N-acetylgalactosaminyltransferase 1-like n=1 Tax=Rhipicephalus sanguineus TaxID=34632 RepID=UPI00189597A0|nr:UDP-GalNAc:beta-1,3-N-acetylgalactosaminyltransferase 1-like [Rhipicephalus sanguineus]
MRVKMSDVRPVHEKLKAGQDILGTKPHQKLESKVLAEHDVYGDIVQGDFVDSYRNLIYKTVMPIR